MGSADISRVSSNLSSKDKLNLYKEISNKKGKLQAPPSEKETPIKSATVSADLQISEEGLNRLKALKSTANEKGFNPTDIMNKIKGNQENLLNAQKGISPQKAEDLLKE